MTVWQRRARIAVATFGLACAAVVYFAMGERPRPATPEPIPPLPPGAVMETTRAKLDSTRGDRRDSATFGNFITYDDGTTRFLDGVRIEAPNRNGRTFVVTAGEGSGTKDNTEVELRRDVRLRESDGFELLTDHGVYDDAEALVRIAGAVSFAKGRMTGSGRGVTYLQASDVLRIGNAEVFVQDDGQSGGMRFTAGSATLDRVQHLLTLEGSVRAIDGTQVTTADRAVVRLSETDDVIRYVELMGQAQVAGGPGSLERMQARDIDLDYADSGEPLERAILKGAGAITLREETGSGRQFAGERLDVTLAPDGSVTGVTGVGRTHVTLPGTQQGAPSRWIEAETFDAAGNGQKDGQLSTARFVERVVFREGHAGGTDARVVRSHTLTVEMSSGEISLAVFSGNTTFEERDLAASAAEATYLPKAGALRLSGRDARGVPRIADHRITVDAPSIDVALDDRRIEATGGVKASLKPGGGRATASGQATRLPGLLRQSEQASVTAESLDYTSASGSAIFTGSARLWQGETEIGARTIDLRQETGDLVATGDARSTIVFESGASTGRAHEIRYVDATRLITYAAVPGSSNGAPQTLPQLN
jgi:lipopolysaccharide export system protein LptA